MIEPAYAFDPDAPEWPATPDGWFQVGNVTPAMVIEANTGPTDPERVGEILKAIAVFHQAKKPLPSVLVEFLAQGVERFITETPTLDAAFGLTARRGRGRIDERISMERALHVLKSRFNGMPFEDAVEKAADELNTSNSPIKAAWRNHREAALAIFLIENYLPRKKLTQPEKDRLIKIFSHKTAHHLHCNFCTKGDRMRLRVPEPRAGAILPWRPRCSGCDHEFTGPELQPFLDHYYDRVMRLRRDVRRLVGGIRRQRLGPPQFPAVEWGGARYIQPLCSICGALRMIEVPAELPDPWDVKCEGCEAVFVDLRVRGPEITPQ